MSQTALRIAGISLVAALASGLAGAANAQLIARKDICDRPGVDHGRDRLATCKTCNVTTCPPMCSGATANYRRHAGRQHRPAHARKLHEESLYGEGAAPSSGDFGDSIKDNFTAGALHLTNIVPTRGALPSRSARTPSAPSGFPARRAARRTKLAPRPASTRWRTPTEIGQASSKILTAQHRVPRRFGWTDRRLGRCNVFDDAIRPTP